MPTFDLLIDNGFLLVIGLAVWTWMLCRRHGAADRMAADVIWKQTCKAMELMQLTAKASNESTMKLNERQCVLIDKLGDLVVRQDHAQTVADALAMAQAMKPVAVSGGDGQVFTGEGNRLYRVPADGGPPIPVGPGSKNEEPSYSDRSDI